MYLCQYAGVVVDTPVEVVFSCLTCFFLEDDLGSLRANWAFCTSKALKIHSGHIVFEKKNRIFSFSN